MVQRASIGDRRAAPRTAVVWQALGSVLDSGPLDVLDIGGGTGGFAVAVAEAGHRVHVVDPNPDALAALARRSAERGVQVQGSQGDISGLLEVAGVDNFDVVLCHGVLEVVADPAEALGTIHQTLRSHGTLSLLVAQRHAAVLARAMAGHFQQARALLEHDPQARAPHRFTHDEIVGLLDDAGFGIDAVHGVRVFADLVPSSLLDLEPGATEALVELESAVSQRSEYFSLAAQLHLLGVRS